MNQLEQLRKYTKIVVDSGEINQVKKYNPIDVTTNPSLILKAIKISEYKRLLYQAISYAKHVKGNKKRKADEVLDRMIVSFGVEILDKIHGCVSIEVDSRLSFNTRRSVSKARKIIRIFEEDYNFHRSRILIKLAATWECIKAAKILEKENIRCNLTLLFSFSQARACAEAKVFLISPFVGRIYDWYKDKNLLSEYNSENDPGVKAVKKIYKYYKRYSYKTIIMGASFRNIEQILSLSGCDRLTISPELLNILQSKTNKVHQVFKKPKKTSKPPIHKLTQSEFKWLHNQDSMAVEKLSEGIRQFGIDQEKLENIILERL